MSDMSKYASSGFIKPEDLVSGPQQKTIMAIKEGRYDKPVATFEDGSRLSLNGTNVSTLIRAFGKNDEDWISQRIELFAGTLRYNGNDNPAVLVRALSSLPAAARTLPKPQPLRDDLNDEVPFN
jgi:fructose 1,6-bisphosphatase